MHGGPSEGARLDEEVSLSLGVDEDGEGEDAEDVGGGLDQEVPSPKAEDEDAEGAPGVGCGE